MRVATSPGRISSMKKMTSETRSRVRSESRIRSMIRRRICISLDRPPQRTRPGRKAPPGAVRLSASGLLAADVLEVQVEVLGPRDITAAALALRQNLVDEHRQDEPALIGQHLAGLL